MVERREARSQNPTGGRTNLENGMAGGTRQAQCCGRMGMVAERNEWTSMVEQN